MLRGDSSIFRAGQKLISLIIAKFFGLSVTGIEHLPKNQPYILVANHCSHLDALVVFHALGEQRSRLVTLAAKDYFFSNPVIRWLVTTLFHAIPVDRQKASRELISTCKEILQNDGILLVFPEGGRTSGPGLSSLKGGVGLLANALDVPVICLRIRGTDIALPKGSRWPKRHFLTATISAPIQYEIDSEDSAPSQSTVMDQINAQMQALSRTGQVALVTGASSGIGAAISSELASRGFDLILNGRDETRLNTIASNCQKQFGVNCESVATDLATEAGLKALMTTAAAHKQLDVLVNNAGLGAFGAFAEVPLESNNQSIDTNIKAVVRLTHNFLNFKRTNGTGIIINIASVYAATPVYQQSVYAASKAFLLSWSRALQLELAGSDVHLTLALPGATATRFRSRMGLDARGGADPVKVARKIVNDSLRHKSTSIPGVHNQAFVTLSSLLPATVSVWLTRQINRGRGLHEDQNNFS